MKRVIYLIVLEISKIISKTGLILNLPILTSISFLISLRKIKSQINAKNKKKILIFEKSHGIDDIKNIVNLKLDNDIEFFLLSRIHAKIIFHHFKNKEKEKYLNYINDVLFFFKKIFKINLIISFNLRYEAEKIFQKINKNLEIKFMVLQKECLFNENALLDLKKYFLNESKFEGNHITTYNEIFKKMLLSSNFVENNKITVVGATRVDEYFASKDKKQEHILYFLIQIKTGLAYQNSTFSWRKLSEECLKTTLDIAENYQQVNFFFKTKILEDKQTYDQQKLIREKNLKNCHIISGGNSFNLIKNAKLIVAFNSTAIFEGLACKKKVLIPYFENYHENLKKYIINTSKSPNIFHAKNDKDIASYLDKVCKNQNEIIFQETDKDKILLENFIGNSNGNSTKKLANLIKEQVFS